jgi:hypothetical protein
MTHLHHWLSRLLRSSQDERGVATVMFALTLPLIIGIQMLTVDASRVFVERRELQNAADAAALAAAQYLPTTDSALLQAAVDEAIMFAAANGVTISPADVEFSTDTTPFDRVTVRTHGSAPFFFAPSIGLNMGAVSSRGTAQLGVLGGMIGVMPWGAEEPPGGFVFGHTYCLKMGSSGNGGLCNQHDQGNFHALDIDDTGTSSASEYRERIINGSSTVVRVGQIKGVASGNMNGPTQQGTGCSGNSGRITGDTSTFEEVLEQNGDTYRVLDWSNPRLVIIPRVEFPDSHQALILGFSAFFIEDCGNNGAVVGRFIDTVVPGGEWAPYNSSVGAYGLLAVRLVQ